MSVTGGPTYDADTRNFLIAAGITDATQKRAVNRLVVDMKAANIWTKMVGLYPFVGGTATTHKWNLKDPRDSDTAFRLTFSGGWTHSATGALPNGTNGSADTYINASTNLSPASNAANFYLNSNADDGLRMTFGAYNGDSFDSYHNQFARYYRSTTSTQPVSIPTPTSKGFFGLSRTSSANFFAIDESGNYTTSVGSSPYSNINRNIYIGSNNGLGYYDNQSMAYFSIATGLTQSEMTLLRTAVINFQTTLKRNV